MRTLPIFFFLTVAGLAACDKASEPEGSRPAAPASTPAPPAAARLSGPVRGAAAGDPIPGGPAAPSDVTWEAPAGWTLGKSSPMRKATYVVPRAAGDAEDGELSVAQAGGSVDQNVARWAQQLGQKPADVKRSERTVNGLAVTLVEIHGDYAGMTMPGAPPAAKKAGFALLGAIVETSPPTFFKLVGPDRTVRGAQRDFERLMDTLHAK
jgi:hypothetical protein